jgi:nucleotide-binding universal stress UspA family protein
MEGSTETPVIVVGVDGSSNAERALGWAIEEAKAHAAAIRIVTAWQMPLGGYSGHGTAPPASTSLEETVREHGDLPVETRVVEGGAAEALIDAARPEDRLVVGSRSKPALPLIITSSVSVQCALHAHCPTTIVR